MGRNRGFSLTELLAIMAVIAVVAGLSVPAVLAGLNSMKMSGAVRSVHAELQNARLKAVSANRPMRVRFNCPVAGQFRMVELLGTPAAPDARDGVADRCNPLIYPYPPSDKNALTRPNNDGPVRYLLPGASFAAGAPTIEFWPDGTAHANTGLGNPWPAIATPVAISMKFGLTTKTITVNGVGKVQIQ